ncbi:MAG: glycosyltransferase family 4 protein [Planctomycetota bacterium]
MTPLRINVVLGPFLPTLPGPAGAIEKLWQGIAEHLAQTGHQVTLVARRYEDQPTHETLQGVRYLRRSGYTRTNRTAPDLARDLAYSFRILAALPPADITVTNAFFLPTLLAWRKRRTGRVVVNVQRYPKKQMWLYDRVDRLSSVSQAVADEIVRQRPSLKPIVGVVPNPVDVDVFAPPAQPIDRPPTTLAFHGRVHPEKGLHLLVEAFARLHAQHPQLKLKLIGPTATEHGGGGQPYLDRLATLAGPAPVEFVAPIRDPAQLAQALRDADLYCYPSMADLGESFGVSPLEAMAVGLPTVVSALACFREFADDDVNALVFDHNAPDAVDRLEAALLRLLQEPDTRRRLAQAGIDKADAFSYPRVASAYERDFLSLVHTPPT